MLTPEQKIISRMSPQRGNASREMQIQAHTDAQRVFILGHAINGSQSGIHAKGLVDEILKRTDTKLGDWEDPYKRKTIHRKGGVLRYV